MGGSGGPTPQPPEATGGEGLRAKPPAAGGKGVGVEPPALGDFYNFSIKIAHFYAYFGQTI